MILCYGRRIADLIVEEKGCKVLFEGASYPHDVPFGAISWVSPDWFQRDK
jgi:hypothetical protein